MAIAVVEQSNRSVARPLNVLVPLIKKDLEQGNEAAARASMPYYRAAGEKMLEAKAQLDRGEFIPWIERNFGVGDRQARRYMSLVDATSSTQNGRARDFSSIREMEREVTGVQSFGKTSWHEPVKNIINKVDTETLNLRREALKRADERDAQRQLALQLIDIGYKALATKLHPDKGGSRDAMARLNQVRDRLKGAV